MFIEIFQNRGHLKLMLWIEGGEEVPEIVTVRYKEKGSIRSVTSLTLINIA